MDNVTLPPESKAPWMALEAEGRKGICVQLESIMIYDWNPYEIILNEIYDLSPTFKNGLVPTCQIPAELNCGGNAKFTSQESNIVEIGYL